MNRDQLLKQVECPVCMEVFRTPKQLPCQHSYCLQCLQTVFDTDREPCVKCPECRVEHCVPVNGIAEFPTSMVIQRLIETLNPPNIPQLQASDPPSTIRNTVIPAFTTPNHERAEARNQGASHICSICRVPDNTWRDTFHRVRHVYRRYLGNLLRNEKLIRVGIVPTMLIMAFSRLIAACFEFLLYGTLPFFYCVTTINRALNNKFVQVWFIIYALFTVIWFFIGTAWIFGYYAEMKTVSTVDYWNIFL